MSSAIENGQMPMLGDPILEEVVYRFGRHWDRRDLDAVISMLSSDIIYQNVPLPALVGHDQVRTFLTPMFSRASAITWKFLSVAVNASGHVLTERVDTFFFGGQNVAVPLMGVFEIERGAIVRWRDYADIGKFRNDMALIRQQSL